MIISTGDVIHLELGTLKEKGTNLNQIKRVLRRSSVIKLATIQECLARYGVQFSQRYIQHLILYPLKSQLQYFYSGT